MARRLELNILSDPAKLREVRVATEQLCRAEGFDARSCDEVGLCVNEALANVIRHAYGEKTDQPISFIAETDADALTIRIRDWGRSFDGNTVKPDKPDPLEPGGLGLICLHQCMDGIDYQVQQPGTLLTLKRKRTRSTPCGCSSAEHEHERSSNR